MFYAGTINKKSVQKAVAKKNAAQIHKTYKFLTGPKRKSGDASDTNKAKTS